MRFRPLGEPHGVAAKARSVVRLPLHITAQAIHVHHLEEGKEDSLFVGEVGDFFHCLGPFGSFWDGIGFRLPGLKLGGAVAAAAAEATQAGVVKSLHIQNLVGRCYLVGVGRDVGRFRGIPVGAVPPVPLPPDAPGISSPSPQPPLPIFCPLGLAPYISPAFISMLVVYQGC